MPSIRIIIKLFIALSMVAVIIATGTYLFFARGLPDLNDLASYQPALSSRVFNPAGELIAEYAEQHRLLMPLDRMPKQLINAFLAAEDAHFYSHPGINPGRIFSAAMANFRAGHTVQGGSTITQQVAKNFLLSSERSYSRKIREIILAYRIERKFTKDEILYLYLNHIYLGRGAYGVASAAWRYFHKRLDELTLAECAMLAGLPKAPGEFAPHLHPDRAIRRRNTVLGMIASNGFASREKVHEAIAEPLTITPLPKPKLVNAYANSVFQELARRFGATTLRRQGLTIVVPYREKDEQAAIRAVRKGVLAIEQRQYYRFPVHHPEETWPDILTAWAEKRKNEAEAPLSEDQIIPALVEEILPEGGLIVNDGIHRWQLPKPKWQWEAYPKPAAEKTPLETPAIAPEKQKRPRIWIPGDEVWLQGNRKKGVRLTQKPSVEASLFAFDLQKGNVIAEVGGFDFHQGDFNRVTRAKRQPGSAFKPFLYATAMDSGFTPATIIMDTPVVFENRKSDEFWRPENYRNRFAGLVTLRDALEHSRNLASIKLLQDIGTSHFLHALTDYQFTETFPAQLALALGSTEVTLKELTESYAVIADGGRRWQPVRIQQIQDRNGKTLHRSVAGNRCQICHVDPVLDAGDGMQPFEQTLDPVSSFLTLNMMRGVIERGTGVRARRLHRPAAGKTGTTNDQVDAWFTGFTPQVLTGVWVGRDKPSSMGRRETGSRAAIPIWLEAMSALQKQRPKMDFVPPDGIEWVMIDRKTGKRADSTTRKPFLEAFRIGTEPRKQTATRPEDTTEPSPAQGKPKGFFDSNL